MNILLTILFIGLISNQVWCTQKVRGVVPERASLYDELKPFSCLDGSAVIPFSQVNDDYCDCRDGSDEPGTSACMNSSFACENLGYIVQLIPSSRVNDGICDCCDGSDEYDGNTVCENKCIALAARMREEEEKIRVLTEQGKAKRKELSDQGTEIRKALEDKMKELEANKIVAEAEKAKLETIKNEAEAKSKEAKEKQDKIIEEKRKELEKIEALKRSKVLFDELDANKDSICSPEELLTHPELDILFDNDGQFTLEEAQRFFDQNNQITFEVFSTTYYEKLALHIANKTIETTTATTTTTELPPVPTAPTTTDNEEPIEPSEDSHNEPREHHEDDHHDHEHEHEHDHDHHEYHDDQSSGEDHSDKSSDNSQYDSETQALIEEANKAQREYQDSVNKLNNIDNDIKETKEKLELDTGANAEFAPMMNNCYEYEDREYVYKLCPFDKTIQKSKSNNGETTIGHWSSWGADANKYLTMKFNNGLACWNGPQRSTLVKLTCGIESKLVSVSEPNRCEYEMKFETPAVCDDLKLNQTNENHDEL